VYRREPKDIETFAQITTGACQTIRGSLAAAVEVGCSIQGQLRRLLWKVGPERSSVFILKVAKEVRTDLNLAGTLSQ
jgi:hypothetical protein